MGLFFVFSENVLLCSAAFDPGQGTVEDVCTNISVGGPSNAGCLKFHLEWPFRAAAVRLVLTNNQKQVIEQVLFPCRLFSD